MLAKLMPGLSDRLFSWAFYKTALDKNKRNRNVSSLHEPGSDGKVLGDQDDPILEVSPYTTAQLHPRATFALGAGIAALAAALIIKRKDVGRMMKA